MTKAVILAGGLGTRIAEESQLRPKPMIEIGGRPIIWHIMKTYARFGITDFVICVGYRGYMLKEYFANYVLHSSDVTIDMKTGAVEFHERSDEDWRVTLVETGEDTMTGGRLKRVRKYLMPGETFCMTYGDGVADIDIDALLTFHKGHGKAATLTRVVPPGRFGALELDGNSVQRFIEKPDGDNAWINGGFFVLEPSVIDYIAGDHISFEREPLANLACKGELVAYPHRGFWQPMDTLRERNHLEKLWASGKAPWKVWEG